MTRKDLFKQAHKLTKRIIRKGDDYKLTFSLCLKLLYTKAKQSVNNINILLKRIDKLIDLKGELLTQNQLKYIHRILLYIGKDNYGYDDLTLLNLIDKLEMI